MEHVDAPMPFPNDSRLADPDMTPEQIREWIEACNHEPARRVLRQYLAPHLEGGRAEEYWDMRRRIAAVREKQLADAFAEIERLNGIIKGVEIALARDEDIKSAMKIILQAQQ